MLESLWLPKLKCSAQSCKTLRSAALLASNRTVTLTAVCPLLPQNRTEPLIEGLPQSLFVLVMNLSRSRSETLRKLRETPSSHRNLKASPSSREAKISSQLTLQAKSSETQSSSLTLSSRTRTSLLRKTPLSWIAISVSATMLSFHQQNGRLSGQKSWNFSASDLTVKTWACRRLNTRNPSSGDVCPSATTTRQPGSP